MKKSIKNLETKAVKSIKNVKGGDGPRPVFIETGGATVQIVTPRP